MKLGVKTIVIIIVAIGFLASILWLMTLISNVGGNGSSSGLNSLTFSSKGLKEGLQKVKPALPEFDLLGENKQMANSNKATNNADVATPLNNSKEDALIKAPEKTNEQLVNNSQAPKSTFSLDIASNQNAEDKMEQVPQPKENLKVEALNENIAKPNVKSTFDVIRVDADGSVVVAGKFAPNSKIDIMIDDNAWGEAETNADGEWVWISSDKLAPGDYELYTIGKLSDAEVKSDRSQVISVPELVLASKTAKKGALVVETNKKGGMSVVKQLPNGKLPQNISDKNPVISTIDYKNGVLTSISGSASSASELNVYIDNQFVAKAAADDKKLWSVAINQKIEDKAYKIRVDMVEKDTGKVISRIESDFKPAFKKIAGRKMIEVVQNGDSLWEIARKVYGDGYAYINIYEANKSQIKDPKKLYPGQIFILPDVQKK